MKIHIEIEADSCPYWNYDDHTQNHSCCDCTCIYEGNNIDNSHFGVMIDKDRYCTLGCKINAKMVESIKEH